MELKLYQDLTQPEKIELFEVWLDRAEVECGDREGGTDAIYQIWPHGDEAYFLNQILPSINWSHVSDEFDWLARDESGLSGLFAGKPSVIGRYWDSKDINALCVTACSQKSYKAGTCDWKRSLIQRPQEVTK